MFKKKNFIANMAKSVADILLQYINVEKLILFGSYAYGKPDKYSDVDIAVISEDFERMNILDQISLFAKIPLAIDSRLELVGFSKKEYLKPESASFLAMIKKKGKIVFSKKSRNGHKKSG